MRAAFKMNTVVTGSKTFPFISQQINGYSSFHCKFLYTWNLCNLVKIEAKCPKSKKSYESKALKVRLIFGFNFPMSLFK